MILSDGVEAMAAFAGDVVLTACILQTVMRAVVTAVAMIRAILRIVLSLQNVPHPSDQLWFV
jgi:hypothetical protein